MALNSNKLEKPNMKKTALKLMVMAGALVATPLVQANPTTLTSPGDDTSIPTGFTINSADVIANETTDFSATSSPGHVGTLESWVLSGDTANNPLGGLEFVYQLTLDASSPDFVDTFSSPGAWGGLNIDVQQGSTGVESTGVTRSKDGTVITWTFAPLDLYEGETSAYLVIDTDATTYGNGQWHVQNGSQSVAYGYVAPDGGLTIAMLGSAMVALGAIRRKLS